MWDAFLLREHGGAIILQSENCTLNICEKLGKRENISSVLLNIVGFVIVRNSILNTIMQFIFLFDSF